MSNPSSFLSLKRRRFPATQHNVKTIAERPLRLGRFQVKFRDQTLPRLFIRNRLQNGIIRKERIAGKIHLRNQSRDECRPKQRKVDMRRAPCIVVIAPRIGARLNGYKAVGSVLARQRPARPGKVRIERRRMVVPGRARIALPHWPARFQSGCWTPHGRRHRALVPAR